jgi:Tfp pilus assembly protein PilV
MRRPTRGEDGGATLIVVLILVTVFSVGLAALLSLSDTSLRTTVQLRGQAAAAYTADGAAKAAINNIRNSLYNNSAGQHCFGGAVDTLLLPPSFSGSDPAAVACSADPTKVLIQCTSLSQCNRPGSAILTLGRIAGEDGINIQQPTGSTFRVHGIVFSNSNINIVNGSLNTNTRVYARGACTGTIQSTPAASCNYGNTANVLGDDPGYAPAAAAAPAKQPLPSCTTPDSVVTFQPGYYDDAAGLSAMMAGNSACKHSTWWFKPGTYYFDFHNAGTGLNPLLSSAGGDVWTVNDGFLVAGTPTNPAGAVVATPAVPAVIPGSCDNPINHATAVGVQFIFGGESQFAVKAGQAEICGTYSASRPPVALYGLTSGAETTTALTGAGALKMSTVVSAGQFSNGANIAQADGANATWVKGSSSSQTGTITVGGYAPPAAVPAGSVLKSATLRVVHGNTAGSTQDNLSVQIAPTGGSPVSVTVPSYGDTAMHTEAIDVFGGGTGPLAQLVYAGTFTGAQATYSAVVKHAGTERIDTVQLELSYAAPAFRAGSGCIVTGPYTGTGSGSCALVSTPNNVGNYFYVQGTTYAPGAVLDVTLNNAAEQIFRFGIVARSLWVKETGSFSYNGVVIEVPDDSPGFVFSVYLTVYVCPGQPTCAPGGTPVLRSKVAFVDTDPTTPLPGQRRVVVLTWSESR